jgi:hypothetical protein
MTTTSPERYFVDTGTLAFRMKVRWFRDLLAHPASRRHLWSLYYAGEAYEELHPQGVYVDKLEPWLGRLLARHLADETRHAAVFRGVMSAEGASPEALAPGEDVGWYLLTHVVPEIVERAGQAGPFTHAEAARYMAFLHVLELRSLSDLTALIHAAKWRGEQGLAESLRSILRDERFHATYTHRAVKSLAGPGAAAILDQVRRAERRHYGVVLRGILAGFEALGATPNGSFGRLRWTFMSWIARLGWAAPLLPLYDRVPAAMAPAARS